MKILFVDDDAMLCKTVMMFLPSLLPEDEIVFANNGEIACDILKQNHDIDIIISDFDMPKMNGAELIAAVRSREEINKIFIILISGMFISSSAISKAQAYGADIGFSKSDIKIWDQLISTINDFRERQGL